VVIGETVMLLRSMMRAIAVRRARHVGANDVQMQQ
jgi:hypothetical protein